MKGNLEKLDNFVQSFIPTREDDKSGWAIRAKVLVISLFFLGCFGSLYNIIYFTVGNWVGGSVIILEVLTVWYLPSYFRKTGDLEKTATYFALSYCLMMTAILLSSGGPTFSGNPWWAIAPVFITLILGEKAGKKWLTVALAVLASTFILQEAGVPLHRLNLISSAEEDQIWVRILDWFHYFGCVLILAVTALVFDHINSESFKAMVNSEDATLKAEEQRLYLSTNVERILGEMQALAEGDLTTNLAIQQKDEIGRLCEGFNQAVERMHETIGKVIEAVNITVHSSEQIAHATGQLATGTEEQTAQVSEINVSVAELAASISQNAQGAQNSSEAARKNVKIAQEGGNIVQESVRKMDEISHVVEESALSISKLAESSQEIGEIVTVIQNVANRTNLLALNASIEAASAGDVGKGFGVIAGEVKDLSSQTTKAAERITLMIENVQNEINRAIAGMKAGNAQVQEGKVLASQAGSALNQIVESSISLTTLVQDIAETCIHQSEQSEKFLTQVEYMKKVSDSSASEISEIPESTEKLESLTEQLQDQLGRFRMQEHVLAHHPN